MLIKTLNETLNVYQSYQETISVLRVVSQADCSMHVTRLGRMRGHSRTLCGWANVGKGRRRCAVYRTVPCGIMRAHALRALAVTRV